MEWEVVARMSPARHVSGTDPAETRGAGRTDLMPMEYNAIWISDVHLGTKHAQVERLLQFLRAHEARHLYVVGDLIDGWELKRKWHWDDHHNLLIQKLLRKSRKRTRVTYITGNHDEFMEKFGQFAFGSVRIRTDAVHVGINGKRYLVIHGHQFDGLTHFNRLLDRVGSAAYGVILDLNHHFNRVRRRLGFGYWSFAACLKNMSKSAVKFVAKYEEAMVKLARERRVDGIICGHIHRAEIKEVQGLEYLNSGDWVESCSALVEDLDGRFYLMELDESPVCSPRGGAGAHDPGDGHGAPGPEAGWVRRESGGRRQPEPEPAGVL
jgi:UDP-2,3-diacylglucosamine pyrophosphatase LpxH